MKALVVFVVAVLNLSSAQITDRNDTVCYPPCGCFERGPPFNARRLPHSPERQELKWELYTRLNPIEAIIVEIPLDWDGEDLPMPEVFNPEAKSRYLSPGWNSSPRGMDRVKDALLAYEDTNVFIVDWQEGATGINYPQPASNSRVAGACSGWVAGQWQSVEYAHCIGHSLGGQMCGYMGEFTNGTMGRITGLDPAGPWFKNNDTRVRLDSTDALFVDTINTDTTGFFPLGIGLAIGDADFFPNNGERQPPCTLPSCDHGISVSYFISSIENNCYKSRPCESREDSDACLCEECTEGEDCAYMGYHSDNPEVYGLFFLRTVDSEPDVDHYCELVQECTPTQE